MLQLFYLAIFITNTYKNKNKKTKQKQNKKKQKVKVEIPQLFLNMTGTICVWKQKEMIEQDKKQPY